ncbi:MAG TPA: tRNA (adenosine(37)-N6)-threonylcarbamoyltransferase complex dimerization subunit type 1 TsaB [Gemmatimonadaceae bacterium]|nr:tRNA (adenosine(37)-N6)-threonylcarbamoyltransferase complex dimerization subunit type 1 TsaB [Gemmatimonadaceae bacterium]
MSDARNGSAASRELATLALDASTSVGTVAVFRGSTLAAEREVQMRGGRDERLMPAVDEALREAGVAVAALDRVVCGAGPGGFTGLRIAASIAKGICLAGGLPLYADSSLVAIVGAARPALPPGHYVAALDALRGEWFAQEVRVSEGGAAAARGPARLARREELAGGGVRVVGPGWDGELRPHARGFAAALRVLDGGTAVDLATWEPDYGRLAEAQARWEAAHGRPLAP